MGHAWNKTKNVRIYADQSSIYGNAVRYLTEKVADFGLEDEFNFTITKTDEKTEKGIPYVDFVIGYEGELGTVTTDAEGLVNVPVKVTGGKSEVIVNIHERTPSGYKPLGYGISLKFVKENDEWTCTDLSKIAYNGNDVILEGELVSISGMKLSVKNEPEDEDEIDLKIYKVDAEDMSIKLNAKFSLWVENGTTDKDEIEVNGIKTITIKPEDRDKSVIVTLQEIEAPDGYKLEDGLIKITYKYKTGADGIGDWVITNKSASNASVSGNILRVTNEPDDTDNPGDKPRTPRTSTPRTPSTPPSTPSNPPSTPSTPSTPSSSTDIIEGYVYLDGYSGNKVVAEPNGTRDSNEQAIKGVIVKLSDGRQTTTDANGYYKFNNINRETNYTVTFEYDGVNYIATTAGAGSQATEVGRDTFNNKFTTINAGQSGAGIKLEYWAYKGSTNYNPEYNGKPGWLLKTLNNNQVINNNDFKMAATTNFASNNGKQYRYSYDIYDEEGNKTGSGVTGWLDSKPSATDTKRNYQISETNYYVHANTTQSERYYDHYNKNTPSSSSNSARGTKTYELNFGLVKREVDLSLVNDLKNVKVSINGKETTYNYEDIPVTGDTVNIGNVSSDANNKTYLLELDEKDYLYGSAEHNYDIEELKTYSSTNKLKIQATYKVVLNNQSNTKATVNSIVYYYDTNYKLNGVSKGTLSSVTQVSIDGRTYNRVEITGLGSVLDAGGQDILEVYLSIDAEGQDIKKETYKTIAEITSYFTAEGKVDIDSAPGNAVQGSQLVYEDDTDTAPGLKLTATGTRIISGYVWDDSKKDGNGAYVFADGVKENVESEIGVQGVIVQLIEIKEIDGNKHYYIWQEKKTNTDGEYEFTNFIPGNYIVRFVYGDDADTAKYNGQDYKSTKDLYYNEYKTGKWYNEYHNWADNTSVARDNEARRLEVMANTAEINTNIGTALKANSDIVNPDNNEVIWNYTDKTYMYADTSKINIAVETETGDETADSNTVNGNKAGTYFNFEHVNFALEERPKTQVEMERHIVGFRITANDGTTIADAKFQSNENGSVKFTPNSIIKGMQAFYATRANRAKWYLATDIEETIQGATLELVYEYTVRNVGEVDYVSTTLAQEFENKSVNDYKTALIGYASEIRDDIKIKDYNSKLGKYLGTTYYTADDKASDVSKVKTHVGKIEDYINNDLKFTPVNSSDFEIGATNTSYTILNEDGVEKPQTIATTVISKQDIGNLLPEETRTQTITLESNGKLTSTGTLNFPGYIAQIKTAYSNPVGRRDVESIPGNLKYIDSRDLSGNEPDEFWVETAIITKPTGADNQTAVSLAITITASLVVLVSGTFAIKKYLL